jgi:hypothetical protein
MKLGGVLDRLGDKIFALIGILLATRENILFLLEVDAVAEVAWGFSLDTIQHTAAT